MHAKLPLAIAAMLALATSSALAQKSAPDTLARIKAAQRINVAFSGDSPPFSSVGAGNRPAGYSIDVCRRVIASIGVSVGIPELRVEWMVGTVAERLAMIESGRADLDCANTSETQSRLAQVDFSNRVFIDAGGLLVKGRSRIDRLADLTGKRIGVIAGTTTEAHLAEALKAGGVSASVVTVREGPEASAMLEAGSLDAFASDKIKLVGLAAAANDPDALRLLPDDISFEPYAFALARGDASMRLAVNRGLSDLATTGEFDAIFRRWLGQYGRPSGLLAALFHLNAIPR